MDGGLATLGSAAIAFAGSHMAMSGPLRRGLRRSLGERGFLLAYTLVSLATLTALIVAFARTAPGTALWNGAATAPWVGASLLTLLALALVLGSFGGNPAMVNGKLGGLHSRKPWGVFKVTRHPLMMGIALWALAHILVAPTPRSLVLCGTLIVLALLGSHFQDRRKLAQFRGEWQAWMDRTSFWPRWRALPRMGVIWGVAPLVWLLLTWGHRWANGIPAGIWRWVH